jgi:hypothetical protein
VRIRRAGEGENDRPEAHLDARGRRADRRHGDTSRGHAHRARSSSS